MKRNVSLREVILLCVLIALVSYYTLVHIPVQKDMEAISAQKTELMSEVEVHSALLVNQKNMQEKIEAIDREYGGKPPLIPEYDNSDAVIMRLNAMLSSAASYNISFEKVDRETSPSIVRRVVTLVYTTKTHSAAMDILHRLAEETFENQISDLSVSDDTIRNDSEDAVVSVSLVMTFFEYAGAPQAAA